MRDKKFTAEYKKRARGKSGLKTGQGRYTNTHQKAGSLKEFTCRHCGQPVSIDPRVSGVQNRNHCPYCLWSRHVDLEQAGDRLAACKGSMKPVGLTLKRTRKKYGRPADGELMLIHQCVECGRVSINRIAADDDPEKVMEVFRSSAELEERLQNQLKADQIEALTAADAAVVESQLYGKAALS